MIINCHLVEWAKYLGEKINNVDFDIDNIQNSVNAEKSDITFLRNNKYKEISLKTKAAVCITSSTLSKHLPPSCIKLIVKDVLFAVTQFYKMFYPTSDIDYPDINLVSSHNIKDKYKNVFFGNNVLIGKNVKLGENSFIGNNKFLVFLYAVIVFICDFFPEYMHACVINFKFSFKLHFELVFLVIFFEQADDINSKRLFIFICKDIKYLHIQEASRRPLSSLL